MRRLGHRAQKKFEMLVDAAAALSIRCYIGGRRRQKYRHNNCQLIVFWRTVNLIKRDLFGIQIDKSSRVK